MECSYSPLNELKEVYHQIKGDDGKDKIKVFGLNAVFALVRVMVHSGLLNNFMSTQNFPVSKLLNASSFESDTSGFQCALA